MVVMVLQWLSVGFGLSAAICWWLSAQSFFSQSKHPSWPPPEGTSDHDLSYVLEDGSVIVQRNGRVALANAVAAVLSGLAVLFQALPQALTLLGWLY